MQAPNYLLVAAMLFTFSCGDSNAPPAPPAKIVHSFSEFNEAITEALSMEKPCNYALSDDLNKRNAMGIFLQSTEDPSTQWSYGVPSVFTDQMFPLSRVLLLPNGVTSSSGALAATWGFKNLDIGVLNKYACGAGSLGEFACAGGTAYGLVTFDAEGKELSPDLESCNPKTYPYNVFLLADNDTFAPENTPNALVLSTWKNQFEAMNKTFGDVFKNELYCEDVVCAESETKPWYECSDLIEVAEKNWWNGKDSWEPAFEYDKANNNEAFMNVAAKLFGGAETANGAKQTLTQISVEKLKGLSPETLCTEPLAVRTYLWVIMDSNSANLGNGKGADGSDEYFSPRNTKLDQSRKGNDGWLSLSLED